MLTEAAESELCGEYAEFSVVVSVILGVHAALRLTILRSEQYRSARVRRHSVRLRIRLLRLPSSSAVVTCKS